MKLKNRNGKSKKSREGLTVPRKTDAIKYQVSIRGRNASKLTKQEANVYVIQALSDKSDGTLGTFQVRIKIWRGGQELDWKLDNPRAKILRANLRRALQAGRITFRQVGHN